MWRALAQILPVLLDTDIVKQCWRSKSNVPGVVCAFKAVVSFCEGLRVKVCERWENEVGRWVPIGVGLPQKAARLCAARTEKSWMMEDLNYGAVQ